MESAPSLEDQARKILECVSAPIPERAETYFWSGEPKPGEDKEPEVKRIRSDFHFLKAVTLSQPKLNVDDGTKDGHNRYLDGDTNRPEPWQFTLRFSTFGNGILLNNLPAFFYSEENGLRFSSERLDEESISASDTKCFSSLGAPSERWLPQPSWIFRRTRTSCASELSPDLAGEYDLDNLKRISFNKVRMGRTSGRGGEENDLRRFMSMNSVPDRPRVEAGFLTGLQLSDYGRREGEPKRGTIYDLYGTIKLPPINMGAIFRTGSLKSTLGIEMIGVYHLGENRKFDGRRRKVEDGKTFGPYKNGKSWEGDGERCSKSHSPMIMG